MREWLRSQQAWARGGGVAALLLSAWFVWSIVAEALWRGRTPGTAWIPLDPWPIVNAIVFFASGVSALRVRPRAQPWLLGGGLVTVFHSAVAALRLDRWSWVAVALGAALVVSAVGWDRAAKRSA